MWSLKIAFSIFAMLAVPILLIVALYPDYERMMSQPNETPGFIIGFVAIVTVVYWYGMTRYIRRARKILTIEKRGLTAMARVLEIEVDSSTNSNDSDRLVRAEIEVKPQNGKAFRSKLVEELDALYVGIIAGKIADNKPVEVEVAYDPQDTELSFLKRIGI